MILNYKVASATFQASIPRDTAKITTYTKKMAAKQPRPLQIQRNFKREIGAEYVKSRIGATHRNLSTGVSCAGTESLRSLTGFFPFMALSPPSL
jgi:hypothetical protein